MNNIELLEKIAALPSNLKEEVSDFVDYLIYKYPDVCQKKKPLKFGMMKGTFTMREDFDDPLDLIDARIVEERRLEETVPFEEFLNQLKEKGSIDDSDLKLNSQKKGNV